MPSEGGTQSGHNENRDNCFGDEEVNWPAVAVGRVTQSRLKYRWYMHLEQDVQLKLKQASAVLGVDPKDLQNLVQFKVLRPRRRDSLYWFDKRLLLAARLRSI